MLESDAGAALKQKITQLGGSLMDIASFCLSINNVVTKPSDDIRPPLGYNACKFKYFGYNGCPEL